MMKIHRFDGSEEVLQRQGVRFQVLLSRVLAEFCFRVSVLSKSDQHRFGPPSRWRK